MNIYAILGLVGLFLTSLLASFLIGRSSGKKSIELTDDSTVLKEQTQLAQTYTVNAGLADANRRNLSKSSPGPIPTPGETSVSSSGSSQVPIKNPNPS